MALQSPHDALFRAAFESPQHAAQLLEALLPDDMLGLVSLTSLELQSGGGRGKDLEEFRSDLLFRASIDGSPGFVCFLFEHQSSSDGRMPLRVLGYQLRIWERHSRTHPDEPLPPIVPIVISHDPKGWRAPCEFADLLSPVIRQHEWLRAVTPHFQCIVDDLSRLSDQDLKARALGAFDTFRARVTELAPAAKEAIMTIAEELRAQGFKEGFELGFELVPGSRATCRPCAARPIIG